MCYLKLEFNMNILIVELFLKYNLSEDNNNTSLTNIMPVFPFSLVELSAIYELRHAICILFMLLKLIKNSYALTFL